MTTLMYVDEAAELLREQLAEIESEVLDENGEPYFTLADAMRLGQRTTKGQSVGWSDTDGNLCALSTARVAIRARSK